jgi:hypothetical protein
MQIAPSKLGGENVNIQVPELLIDSLTKPSEVVPYPRSHSFGSIISA